MSSLLLAVLAGSLVLDCRESEVRFADADLGFAVTGLVDRASGVSFLAPSRGKSDFWALDFQRRLPNGSNALARIDNHAYARSRQSRIADGVAEFSWRGINLTDEKGVLDVTARVRFDAADGLAHWTLAVTNRSAAWALVKTTYPSFREIAPEGAADVLMPGNNLGAALYPRHVSTNNIYDGVWNPGSHPMVAAWHLNGTGLYVAAHDGESRLKKMTFYRGEQGVRFETIVENAGVAGKAVGTPGYEVVTGTYRGDWWRAAKIYRAWALKQKWARKGPIVRRPDYPKRLSDAHLWFLKHEDSLEASDAFTRARAAWPDVNLAAEITCWNPLPFDVGYPEYFPASAGVPQAIAAAKLSGVMVMPYMNGRLWDVDIPSFAADGARDACRDENGALYTEKWNKKRNTFAIMCPTGKGWSKKVYDNVRRVIGKELGGNCIYLDQITASRARACYNPEHGHTLGGGRYWADGYRAMLEKAHRRLAANKVPLTSEGAGDTWLDCVDGYLLAVIPEPTDVPFYTAVYSGYATYYGCRLLADASAAAFWAVETQATLNGVVPGWTTAFTLMKGREDFVKTLDRLGKFRQANAGFFAYGSLEDELRFVEEPRRVKVEWDNARQKLHYAPELRSIAGSVWRNPAGDADGVALANLSDAEQTATIRLPSARPFAVETADGFVSFLQEGAAAHVKLGPRALAFVRTPRAAPPPETFDVYLLIGQSNMAGRGALTPSNRVSSERVLKLDAAGEWTDGVEPLHWDLPVAAGGLGATFARRMADANPNRTIGLVPCADGGTSLELWMPGRYLYRNAVRRAKEAMKTGRLRGILWHQGEADATESAAADYGARLATMVTALRRDLGVGDVPFVAGELAPFLDRLVEKRGICPAWRTINAQLHDFVSRVPNAALVSAEGLDCNADLIHIDCAGQRLFGERYAAALNALRVR